MYNDGLQNDWPRHVETYQNWSSLFITGKSKLESLGSTLNNIMEEDIEREHFIFVCI